MTASQPNLLELAKQGDARAIAALMNRQLQPKGVTAKATLKDGCLQVVLEAAQVPNQQALVSFICKGLTGLEIKEVTTVKVYGRQIGKELPDWHQEFKLLEKSSTTLNSSPHKTAYSKPQDSIVDLPEKSKQVGQRDSSTIPPLKHSSAKPANNGSLSAASPTKFKFFAASKKKLILLAVPTLGLTISWLIYSNIFSNRDAVFNNEISHLLNKSSDLEMNKKLQKIFDDLFGYEKAQEIGRKYCQERISGLGEEEIIKRQAKQALLLMSQQKAPPEEAANMTIVEVDIHLAASKAYCPELKSAELSPLKESLKQQESSEKAQFLAEYKDKTRIPLGGGLTLDITSAKQIDNGFMEVIGGSNKDKDLRLRYVVDCGEKTLSMTGINGKGGKEGWWRPSKNPRTETNAAFSALVCH